MELLQRTSAVDVYLEKINSKLVIKIVLNKQSLVFLTIEQLF